MLDSFCTDIGQKLDYSILIDNTEKNLVIPKSMGMCTVLFDDENSCIHRFKQDLKSLI